MASEPRSDDLLDLGAVLLSEQTLDQVLQHVLRLSSRSLPSVTTASISLVRSGRIFTSNAIDELALRADEAQYSSDGPCVWAIRSGDQHSVRFPEQKARWPQFSDVVLKAGIHSVLSTPLHTGDETIGALNLYSSLLASFDLDEQHLAAEFARHASILLSNAIAFMASNTLAENLREALLSREAIGVATGLLMVRPQRSRQEAFDVLRRASQRQNRKLRDIALDMIASAEGRTLL